MKKQNLHIDEAFILNVISGQASESDKSEFNNWVKEKSENEEIVKKIEKVLELTNKARSTQKHEKNWSAIQQKIKRQYQTPAYITINKDNNGSVTLLRRQWIRIAASVVIIIGLGLVFNHVINTNKTYTITVSNEIHEPSLLSDGSEITLNTGSALTYTGEFNKKVREVTLSGEAFFSIAKNEDKPFIIHTLNTTTRVVGTAFNILTDTLSKEIHINVESGKVEFYNSDNPSRRVYLTKGEEGLFNLNTQELIKKETSDVNYLAWRTGVLKFDDTPLNTVFKTLEKQYKTNIISRDSIVEDLRLTSKYSNQSLEQIFNELKLLLDIDYKIINDTIYVK